MTGYATREVAQILGLTASRVRAFVRAGLLQPARGPRGQYRFSFPDLAVLRTARGLLDARISPRRVRRALSRLAREAEAQGGLSGVRVAAEGGRIVAADGAARWQPESGQTLFDFEGEAPVPEAPAAAALAPPPNAARGPATAEDWHALAGELEEASPEQARAAYEAALAMDPELSDAHVNLGRLLHERGDASGAEAHYRRALAAHPHDATAAFNLGVALEDLGREAEALDAYERALAADPLDADAHFNAAALCERLRRPAAALAHWKSYRKLVGPRA
jgi:tetratricopeptide (TPR) repeat protein